MSYYFVDVADDAAELEAASAKVVATALEAAAPIAAKHDVPDHSVALTLLYNAMVSLPYAAEFIMAMVEASIDAAGLPSSPKPPVN